MAAGAAVLFGSSFVATAFALRLFGPLAVGAWRGSIALVVVGLLILRGSVAGRSEWAALDRAGRLRLIVLGALGGPIFIVAMNVAVGAAGATITAFAAGLYAVLAALLGPLLLGERLGRTAVVAFAVALGGTALLADIDLAAGGASTVAGGVLTGLGGAVSFALYLVLARRWGRTWQLPGSIVALANFGATTLVLAPLAVLVERPPLPAGPGSDPAVAILAVGWLVVGPSVLAQMLLIASVHRLPARASAAFLLLNPLTATGLAALLLGERLSGAQLAGAGLVLAAIALATGLLGRVATARGPFGRGGRSDGPGRPEHAADLGAADRADAADLPQGPNGGRAATR